ncbi:MAG: D-alanyl-D-alanine carboxypeptidase/D-alanyl-D-alanine-endopeptidase [Bacteroidetes bacterium]|nr:D-alanyl-D-alanine carboxypeptidase/D-alanyl-D-alanine-endopeptidase [Bacteroidota bacterium]
MKRKLSILVFLFFVFSNLHAVTKLEALQSRIDSIVNSVNYSVSVQIVSADKYDVLYSYNPQKKMIPASISKVVTSIAAINYLGPGYEFKTIIYTDDNNIADGVINGNLYIKGYGDPDLNSNDIRYLAKNILAKNITSITGNIIYDESFLDDTYYGLANYYSNDTKKQYWPYVNALALDKNSGGYNPASSAASLLQTELQSGNVQLGGIIVAGVTPTGAKQITDVSHSIFDVMTYMNKTSDNHSAITMFKVIGAKYKGAPGTLEKGQEAVNDFLVGMGNSRSSFEILEGSGLTRYNAVTSDLYIRMLKYMYDDEKIFDFFYRTLPIAGKDGTLSKRMIGTEAEGNIHAKTGTINSVSTLSGYAVSRDSELLIFFIAMNGFGGSSTGPRDKQDYICEAICQFSRK